MPNIKTDFFKHSLRNLPQLLDTIRTIIKHLFAVLHKLVRSLHLFNREDIQSSGKISICHWHITYPLTIIKKILSVYLKDE